MITNVARFGLLVIAVSMLAGCQQFFVVNPLDDIVNLLRFAGVPEHLVPAALVGLAVAAFAIAVVRDRAEKPE